MATKHEVTIWIGKSWTKLQILAEDVKILDNFVCIQVDSNNSISYNHDVVNAIKIGEVEFK